ncbi:MAG: PTS sugar transporter subunit IIC [Thermodesulfobacteriota bacterium]
MWCDLIMISLVGGLLALDRTAAFQVMISRPIVAGPIIGLLLGRLEVGLAMGALTELIYLGRPPLGGYLPPNDTLAAVIAAGAVILAWPEIELDRARVTLGFLLVPPLARMASVVDNQARRANGFLAGKAWTSVSQGQSWLIPYLNLTGLAIYFGLVSLYLLVMTWWAARLLAFLHPRLPAFSLSALKTMYVIIPLIGVAAILGALHGRKNMLIFLLVALMALALSLP